MKTTPENTKGTKTFHLHGDNAHATIVARRDPDGFRLGISLCSSQDNFNRKLGRMIAFGRLQAGVYEQREGKGFFFLPGFAPLAQVAQPVRDLILHLFEGEGNPLHVPDPKLINEMAKLTQSLPHHLTLDAEDIKAGNIPQIPAEAVVAP